jgi:hypothetical protein
MALSTTSGVIGVARVHDFTARRIERALARRQRYRYVLPVVTAEGGAWVVSSPCCSRNVDPEGGEIPIARLEPVQGGWALHARSHEAQRWVLHSQSAHLVDLLDQVCRDEGRVFWP